MPLVDWTAPDWMLARVWRVMYIDRMQFDDLRTMAALDMLAEGRSRHAARHVEHKKVEDWRRRLESKP